MNALYTPQQAASVLPLSEPQFDLFMAQLPTLEVDYPTPTPAFSADDYIGLFAQMFRKGVIDQWEYNQFVSRFAELEADAIICFFTFCNSLILKQTLKLTEG